MLLASFSLSIPPAVWYTDIMNSKAEKSPMDYALGYLGYRQRTEREVADYLDKKDFGEADVDTAVERLKELGLLNDAGFAEDFVRTRLAAKPISRAHLREQLYQHHIANEYIDAALALISDETEQKNADAVMEKYFRQLSGLDDADRRNRCGARLASRGFSFDTIRTAWAHVSGADDT